MTAPSDSFASIVAELREVQDEVFGLAGYVDRIERLDAEMRKRIQVYRERLEVTEHYVMDKATDELVRVDNPPDVDEKYDGIYCRDETIKCLEESRAELRARLAAFMDPLNGFTLADAALRTIVYDMGAFGTMLSNLSETDRLELRAGIAQAIERAALATRASVPKDAATGDEGKGGVG